jgi:hypothetical protein
MLLISKTYEVITEKSAAHGDAEDRGFEWEDSPNTVRETADYLRGREPSQNPITDLAQVWFTEYGDADFRTGEVENTSIHFSHKNRPHALRYWRAAILAAGFTLKD